MIDLEAPPCHPGSMRVLVVDDEEILQELMRESLEGAGWTVVTTGDADEALGLASRDAFDVALVDLNLDGRTSGATLCRALVARGVPVLVVSGQPDAEVAHAAGACELVPKPFVPSELVAAIDRVLGRDA